MIHFETLVEKIKSLPLTRQAQREKPNGWNHFQCGSSGKPDGGGAAVTGIWRSA